MKALSVKQPWALAIGHGKDVENRTWGTIYRGPIAVHASKTFDDVTLATLDWIEATARLKPGQLQFDDHRGAVVAVAEIVGCHQHCDPTGSCGATDPTDICSVWAQPHHWHWELSNVRTLADPVPCKGALGLWHLPDEVEAAVHAQLTLEAGAS